jgi:lactoylglutathione lyase/glyoxylase I family protein
VAGVDETIAKLRARRPAIVAEPFILPAVSRNLAFLADPFANLIELAELLV